MKTRSRGIRGVAVAAAVSATGRALARAAAPSNFVIFRIDDQGWGGPGKPRAEPRPSAIALTRPTSVGRFF